MKINKNIFYQSLLCIILLLQIYLPSFKINVFLQLTVLIFYFFFEKPIFKLTFFKLILPLILICILGFISSAIYTNPIELIIKDFIHFLKPLLGLILGYLIFKEITVKEKLIKTIVITGFISAIIHFLIIIFLTDFGTGSIHSLRAYTKDNFLELFALFFLGYYQYFYKIKIFKSRNIYKIIFFTILFSCIFYFSRTMIVIAIVLFFSVYGYLKLTLKSLKIIIIGIFSISILYVYLYSTKIERNKPGIEAFLFKIKIAPEELLKTKIDRENHKDLWDHWRGYEAKRAIVLMNKNPLSYILGTGYGSLVNLKFYAPLSNDRKGMKYISVLHNGYLYILYKVGFLGLILYLIFLFKLYKFIYRVKNFNTIFISAIGVFYFFTTLTITGIFNSYDTIIIILGCLLFSYFNNKNE